jgi:D-lyxose ketol-isomerase
MKRSEINRAIDEARAFFQQMAFPLPPYAFWSPEDWLTKGPEYDEVRSLGLGWDVTDFGSGQFSQIGRTLFTLRNGSKRVEEYPKSYAQKVLYLPEGQKSTIHHHKSKMEDICNQGGGHILVACWRADADGMLSDQPLELSLSGRRVLQPAGEPVRIPPGDSVCVPPLTYHQFWAEMGKGPVLSVEISSVCDDYGDNYFLSNGERFPSIQEDEPARYVLCNEYRQIRK